MPVSEVRASKEYRAIAEWYGELKAARSGLKLINHIDEGLVILDHIGASQAAQRAYCLHPLCQADLDLKSFSPSGFDSHVIMLVMEYRNVANRHLSNTESRTKIKVSPLKAVNDMLIADKVQNRKDFLLNQSLYPNRFELVMYFEKWLEALGVSEAKYKALIQLL